MFVVAIPQLSTSTTSAWTIKMERVQWNQEQMLSELKDLQQKRIFSSAEVREILKKRSGFETALIRRTPRKRDFLAYIEYEMNLERLRRMRVKKLSGLCQICRRVYPDRDYYSSNWKASLSLGSFNGSTSISDL